LVSISTASALLSTSKQEEPFFQISPHGDYASVVPTIAKARVCLPAATRQPQNSDQQTGA
jgi:hypothetical protein